MNRPQSENDSSRQRQKAISRKGWWILLVAVAAMLFVRLLVIGHSSEPDNDAYGHYSIARSLVTQPWRLDLHWVWLPGYHYFLSLLIRFGATLGSVRVLNALLAALLPVVVYAYAMSPKRAGSAGDDRTIPTRGQSRCSSTAQVAAPESHASVALWGAIFCAVASIVNLMAVSAQQETLFSVLVLLTAWAIDRERFVGAGLCLAAAAMIRYEAWGAVALLSAMTVVGSVPRISRRIPPTLARACQLPFVVVMPSLVLIAGWLVVHRMADGQWFVFLKELHRFTHVQRDILRRAAWWEVLWFPAMLPLWLFGPAFAVALFGLRRAWRQGFFVPFGVYAFLLASYASQGVLGSARYYASLAPFICWAAAQGAIGVTERRRGIRPWLLVGIAVGLVACTFSLGASTFRHP